MIVSSDHTQSQASSSSPIRWFQKRELDHRLSLTFVRFTGRDVPLRTKAARPVFELLAHEARHLVNVKGQWSSTKCMQPVVVVLGKFPPDDTKGGRISKNKRKVNKVKPFVISVDRWWNAHCRCEDDLEGGMIFFFINPVHGLVEGPEESFRCSSRALLAPFICSQPCPPRHDHTLVEMVMCSWSTHSWTMHSLPMLADIAHVFHSTLNQVPVWLLGSFFLISCMPKKSMPQEEKTGRKGTVVIRRQNTQKICKQPLPTPHQH